MPSPYWGDEAIWDSRANVHNPMLDQRGRLWLTSRVRGPDTPAFCREGSDHPSAQIFPTTRTGRNLAMYDPATQEFTLVDTCYSTHHLIFAEDDDNTIWTSGGGQVIGWLNTRMLEETGDEAASQGWSPLVLDTNGNGRRDEWIEPGEPADPTKDTRIRSGYYGVAYNPTVVAPYLDQSGLVVEIAKGQMRAARQHHWAEPLEDALRSYLRAEISSALGFEVGIGRIERLPWEYTVDVYIDQLHGTMGGRALIEAGYRITPQIGLGEVSEYHFSSTAPLPREGYAGVFEAETDLARQLAHAIAKALAAAAEQAPNPRLSPAQ